MNEIVTANDKICPACNTLKPLSFFYKNKARKDGKTIKCKLCTNIRTLEIESQHLKKSNYILTRVPVVLSQVAEFVNMELLSFDNFLRRCPYTFEYLLIKNRAQDVKDWRQVGLTIKSLECNNWTISSGLFNRDHATAIHSAKVILNALEGFNTPLKEKFLSAFSFECIKDEKKHVEAGLNEMICLVEQENRFFDLLNNSVTFNEVKTIFI
jgi:hypothetical protein